MPQTRISSFFIGGRPYDVYHFGPMADRMYHFYEPDYWLNLLQAIPEEESGRPGSPPSQADVEHRILLHRIHESFFSHFFAMLQAPGFEDVWLAKYSATTLYKLAKRLVDKPWAEAPHVPELSRPEALVRWALGYNALDHYTSGTHVGTDAEVSAAIRAITLLARGFTSNEYKIDHAALKHGFRSFPASLRVTLAAHEFDQRHELPPLTGAHHTIAPVIGDNQLALRTLSIHWDPARVRWECILGAHLLSQLLRTRQISAKKSLGKTSPTTFRTYDYAALLDDQPEHTNSLRAMQVGFPAEHLPIGDRRPVDEIQESALENAKKHTAELHTLL